MTADNLATIMKQLKKRIIGLLESGSITDGVEKENLGRLIKTKKWNPYCIRHSAITADSDYLPEFALRKKARWVMNSKQPARYIKARMGNDLKQKILVQNGILTEVESKPASSIADCARCRLINPLENKYCSACGYPLSVAAYEELKVADNEELNKLKVQMYQLRWWANDTLEVIAKHAESKDPAYAENLRWHRKEKYFDNVKEEREAIAKIKQLEAAENDLRWLYSQAPMF